MAGQYRMHTRKDISVTDVPQGEKGQQDTARKNARATITTLLYSFGFQQVDVT